MLFNANYANIILVAQFAKDSNATLILSVSSPTPTNGSPTKW